MRVGLKTTAAIAAIMLTLPFAAKAVAETDNSGDKAAKPTAAVTDTDSSIKTNAKTGTQQAVVVSPKAKPKHLPPSLRASINLTSQTMTVIENGVTKHVWKISSGRKGYHTPTGTYRPQWMTRMHYSKKYDNAPMPHSVFYHGGFAIHATYATGRLGSPASHGCIRLSPSNAKKFYQMVSKHGKGRTRIAITGSTPKTYYAKKKKTKRKTYAASGSNFWNNGYWKPANKKPAYQYKKYKKKAHKPSYSYSYYKPKYRWPGD